MRELQRIEKVTRCHYAYRFMMINFMNRLLYNHSFTKGIVVHYHQLLRYRIIHVNQGRIQQQLHQPLQHHHHHLHLKSFKEKHLPFHRIYKVEMNGRYQQLQPSLVNGKQCYLPKRNLTTNLKRRRIQQQLVMYHLNFQTTNKKMKRIYVISKYVRRSIQWMPWQMMLMMIRRRILLEPCSRNANQAKMEAKGRFVERQKIMIRCFCYYIEHEYTVMFSLVVNACFAIIADGLSLFG